MRFRVLDLDNSVAVQPFLGGLLAAGEADYIDARDLAPKLRIVANRAALAELGRRLQVRPSARHQGDADVVYYGSGDFHHLTYLFLQQLDEPVTVVHFDNHPDWVRFPRTVNCGSWVARAVEIPNVRKVITIGPCSDDLANPQLKGADLRAIRAGRLEMYAWQAAPTRVWGRPVQASGVDTVGGRSSGAIWGRRTGADSSTNWPARYLIQRSGSRSTRTFLAPLKRSPIGTRDRCRLRMLSPQSAQLRRAAG